MKIGKIILLSIFLASNSSTQAKTVLANGLFQDGLKLENSRHYSQAFIKFQQNLKAFPNDADTLKELGNCSYYLENYYDAAMFYRRYVVIRPQDESAKVFLVSIQTSLDNADVEARNRRTKESLEVAAEEERKVERERAATNSKMTPLKWATLGLTVICLIALAVLVNEWNTHPTNRP